MQSNLGKQRSGQVLAMSSSTLLLQMSPLPALTAAVDCVSGAEVVSFTLADEVAARLLWRIIHAVVQSSNFEGVKRLY